MEKSLNEISLLWNNVGLFNDISKLSTLDHYNYDLINLENTDNDVPNTSTTNNENENVILNNINTISHKWNILLETINNNANELKLHEEIIHNLSELTLKEIQLHNNFKHINNNYNNLLNIKHSLSAKISRIEHIYNYYSNVNNYENYINNINSNIVKLMSTNDLSNNNKILDELITLILKIKDGMNFFTLNTNYYKSDTYKNKYYELFRLLLYYIKLFIKLYVFVAPHSQSESPRNTNTTDSHLDTSSDRSNKDNKDKDTPNLTNMALNNSKSITLINKLLTNITDEHDDILQIQVYYVNYRLNLINDLFTSENFSFSKNTNTSFTNRSIDSNDDPTFYNTDNNNTTDRSNKDNKDKDNSTLEIEYATNLAVHLINTEMHMYKLLFNGVNLVDNDNILTLVNSINTNFNEYLKRYYNSHVVQGLSKNNYSLNNVLVRLNNYKYYLVNTNTGVNINSLNNYTGNIENLLINNFNNNFNIIYNNNICKNYPYNWSDYAVVNNMLKTHLDTSSDNSTDRSNKDNTTTGNNNTKDNKDEFINNKYINPVVYYTIHVLNNYNIVINNKKLNKLIVNNVKKLLNQFVNNYFKKLDSKELNKSLLNINTNMYLYNNYYFLVNVVTSNRDNTTDRSNKDNKDKDKENEVDQTKVNELNQELLNELNNNLNNLKLELSKLLINKLSEYKSDNNKLLENVNKLYNHLLLISTTDRSNKDKDNEKFALDLVNPICECFNLSNDFSNYLKSIKSVDDNLTEDNLLDNNDTSNKDKRDYLLIL